MSLLAILEIFMIVFFGLFFAFWVKEIRHMRRDLSSLSASMSESVVILEALKKINE